MKLSESASKSKHSFNGVPSKHSAFSKQIPSQTRPASNSGGGKSDRMSLSEPQMPQKAAHIEHTSAQKAALSAAGFSTNPTAHNNRRQSRLSKRTAMNTTYRSTYGLVRLFKMVNPKFGYNEQSNPRRVLTKPSERGDNQGYDNKDHDYILYVHDVISGHRSPNRYQVLDLLGKGTFGQVVKCLDLETNEYVALKIVKNLPAFHSQGLVEVKLLQTINSKYDSDVFPMVRMLDNFVFRNHLCLVFELLNVSLYELIRQNQFRGLSVQLVSIFTKQILTSMVALHQSHIIHCDLKPENILLEDASSPNLKVIDFGSACFDNQAVYTYIQSRFYRSPEVILGIPYKMSIDIWSLGCIVFELFVGLPLFPGLSQHRMLMRFIKFLGMPPYKMLSEAKDTSKFFNRVGHSGTSADFVLKTDEEYSRHIAALTGNKSVAAHPFRDYFKAGTIQAIVMGYEYKSGLSKAERDEEVAMRKAMLSFLDVVLQWDPEARWTPEELLTHPFITGKPCPEGVMPRPTKAMCNELNPLLHVPQMTANMAGATLASGLSSAAHSNEMQEDESSEQSYVESSASTSSTGSSGSGGAASTISTDLRSGSTSTSLRSGTTSSASAHLLYTPSGANQGHPHQPHSGSIPTMSATGASAMSISSGGSSSARAMSGPLLTTSTSGKNSAAKVPSLPGLGTSPSMAGQSPLVNSKSPQAAMDITPATGTVPSGNEMLIDEDSLSEGAASTSSNFSSPAHAMIELGNETLDIGSPQQSGKRTRSTTENIGGVSPSHSRSGSGSGSGSSTKRQKHASAGSSSSGSQAGRRHSGSNQNTNAATAATANATSGVYSPFDDTSHMMDIATSGTWSDPQAQAQGSQFQRARFAGTDMMVDNNYMGGSGTVAANASAQNQALLGGQRQGQQGFGLNAGNSGLKPYAHGPTTFNQPNNVVPGTLPTHHQMPSQLQGAPNSYGKVGALDSSGSIHQVVGDFEDNLTFWDPEERLVDYGSSHGKPPSGQYYGTGVFGQQQNHSAVQPPQATQATGQLSYIGLPTGHSSFSAALQSPTAPSFLANTGTTSQPSSAQYYYGQGAPGSSGRRPYASNSLAVPGQQSTTSGVSSYGSSMGSSGSAGVYPNTFGLGLSPYDAPGHHFFSGSYSSSSSFAQPTLGSSYSSTGAPTSYGSSYPTDAAAYSYEPPSYGTYGHQGGLPTLSSSFLVSPSSDANNPLKRAPGPPQGKQPVMSSPPTSRAFRRNPDAVQ